MLDFGFTTLLLEFCAKLRNHAGALSDCRRTRELDGLCQNEGKELKKKNRQNQNQIRFIFHKMLKHS